MLAGRLVRAWSGSRRLLGRGPSGAAKDSTERASSLVHHILTIQLAITAVIGVLALASLSWTSQTIIENNLSRWATQWTSQLNELGAPLYLSDETAARLNVESFVATYPEVAYVKWYSPDGEPLFSVAQDGLPAAQAEALDAATVATLTEKAGTPKPQLLDENFGGAESYRLLGPI